MVRFGLVSNHWNQRFLCVVHRAPFMMRPLIHHRHTFHDVMEYNTVDAAEKGFSYVVELWIFCYYVSSHFP